MDKQILWNSGMPVPHPPRYIRLPILILLVGSIARPAIAESCLAPIRPYVPSDPAAAREYADLIRKDFELYIEDIQSYFRCLESERARALEEAREISEEYGTFLEQVDEYRRQARRHIGAGGSEIAFRKNAAQ